MLRWFGAHARDLPWRRTRDPYKIWISEIMLQQTQVDTVIPYYEKWTAQFPTVEALAGADIEVVMQHWAGLGYYRRARMLHETAKILIEKFDGALPPHVEALKNLPGIGKYTAGAIASIAFGQRAPLLDGNVMRILTRIHAMDLDITKPKTLKELWKLSESLIPGREPGDFNQSMMELGATICLPENPRCGKCPVKVHCVAHSEKRETDYPVKGRREASINKTTAALVCWRDKEVLIQRQPKEGRWGGLWMFPHWENEKTLVKATGLRPPQLKKKMTVQHCFTKYRIQLEVFESLLPYRPPIATESRWVRMELLANYAFPSPHQKIVKELLVRGR